MIFAHVYTTNNTASRLIMFHVAINWDMNSPNRQEAMPTQSIAKLQNFTGTHLNSCSKSATHIKVELRLKGVVCHDRRSNCLSIVSTCFIFQRMDASLPAHISCSKWHSWYGRVPLKPAKPTPVPWFPHKICPVENKKCLKHATLATDSKACKIKFLFESDPPARITCWTGERRPITAITTQSLQTRGLTPL